jgi:lysyl-tRNA synthetase class 2
MSALTGKDAASFEYAELGVREAYLRFALWDPWEDWDADRFDFDMATKIEPAIKELGGFVFLKDYPVQAASLAKLGGDGAEEKDRFAERWELYWDGMELANCFSELCDEREQRLRFERAKAARRLLGEADYPLDEDFFGCLPEIGRAAGVALGVDRLVMMLTRCGEISDVRA